MRAPFAPEADAWRGLTSRPFVVMDTETTRSADDGLQRLVSYAILVLDRGQPDRRRSFWAFVDPGVPIDPASTAVHGITSMMVAGKMSFAGHADRIRQALTIPDAVFVAHNAAFDINVLAHEYALLGQALPTLPVLDTMWLPKTVGFQPDRIGARPSLALLCQVLGIPLEDAHRAEGDTAATGRALLALLRHTANDGRFASITDLLFAHGNRTTTPNSLPYIGSRDQAEFESPSPEHLARHRRPLPENPSTADLDEWVSRARECALTRCNLLAEECAAAVRHADLLFKPTAQPTPEMTEPGQLGTLLGGMIRLLHPRMKPRQELRWWRSIRDHIRLAPPCADRRRCPDCRDGNPCPLDVAHEYVAHGLLFDDSGETTEKRIDDYIMKGSHSHPNRWAEHNPDIAGHVAWLCMQQTVLDHKPERVDGYYQRAIDLGLHHHEPRLALRWAQQRVGQGQHQEALALLGELHRAESTNPAQQDLRQAIARITAHANTAELDEERDPRYERLRRPEGRRRANPFALPPQQLER